MSQGTMKLANPPAPVAGKPAALVQRKVRVTAGMDAEVRAYGQAQGKADLAEAYRSIIGRGLRAYRSEAGMPR